MIVHKKHCVIVIVGHNTKRPIYSTEKEMADKIVFITEEVPQSGTLLAQKALNELIDHFQNRRVEIENVEFDFMTQTKPIAQLVHLIYQLRMNGYQQITINLSGGLRYIIVWFYIASCITDARVIHGYFKYKNGVESGLNYNFDMVRIPFKPLTDKQLQFLELFFKKFKSYNKFFSPNLAYNENPLINETIIYESIEKLTEALKQKRKDSTSRGAVDGFVQKFSQINGVETFPNPENKKETSVKITYLGIALFLNEIYNKYIKNEII